jgi:hypothetical protein
VQAVTKLRLDPTPLPPFAARKGGVGSAKD